MMAFLQHLLGTLPIVAALLLVRSANVKRRVRVQQVLLPVVAVLYAAIVLVVLYQFNDWFDSVLKAVFDLVPVLRPWYSTEWLYLIENTVAIVVFVGIKLAVRPLGRRAEGERFLGSALAACVYHYDAEYGQWFVQRRLGGLRAYYRVFYWASIVIAVIWTVLAEAFPGWIGFTGIAFPAVATLVVGELFFCVDGLTKHEYQAVVSGDEDASRRIARYGMLRRVLRDTFTGRALADGVTLASSDALDSNQRLSELRHAPEDLERMAGEYFERVKQSDGAVDTNLVDAAVRLMRGTSVVVNNPFYRDLTPYLCFAVYYHLLHYGKCLIVCGRDASAPDLARWMRSGLEEITGVPALWRVEALTGADPDGLDVGILRSADLHNFELLRANDEFLGETGIVILAEPSRMLATGQLGLGIVMGRCGRKHGHPPVYTAFDRNHDGLVDTLSHLLKADLTSVVASALPSGMSFEMIWRADGPHMHSAILPSISRYLGVGTAIGAVALKYQVETTTWVGADAFPVQDMAWIAGQYYGQIGSFADSELSQHAFERALEPVVHPWSLPQAPNRFLVVEDEAHNAYEAVRLYATRAREQGFVNVIAQNYLLRDYMIDNSAIFQSDPKAIPSFVPGFTRTERNCVLRMLLLMREFGITDLELARELEVAGIPVPPTAVSPDGERDGNPALEVLRALALRHTGVDDLQVSAHAVDAPEVEGGAHESYRLVADGPLESVFDELRPAYFFVEDELGDSNYIGAALYGHVHQLLVPGQYLTHAGKYYQVRSVGQAALRGGVILRRAADHISSRAAYRPMRRFSLTGLTASDNVGADVTAGGVQFLRLTAGIQIRSLGYLEMEDRGDLATARRVEVGAIPDRAYRNKDILTIRLPGVPDAARRTIAVLLNELFITIFPGAHHLVVALTADPERECGDLLDELDVDGDTDAIFVVEDSLVDLGLIVALERHRTRVFEIIADYLAWSLERAAVPAPPETADVLSPEAATATGVGPVDFLPASPEAAGPEAVRGPSDQADGVTAEPQAGPAEVGGERSDERE